MSQAKLDHYFNLYSRNWTALRNAVKDQFQLGPDIDDVVICPLCFGVFTREHLIEKELTLEHLPPEKLGGKIRTMTCKACNNHAGTLLDSQLIRKAQLDNFSLGISASPIKADATINNTVRIPINLFNDINNGLIMTPPDKLRKQFPQRIESFTRYFVGPNTKRINFRIRAYHGQYTQAALLRIGYLWAFSAFGYGFAIMNSNLGKIREQIDKPTESILPTWGILEQDFPDEFLGINVITSPKEAQCFLAIFQCVLEGKLTKYGVILPGFGKSGLEVYRWLDEHQNIAINYEIVHFVEKIDFNSYPLISDLIWSDLKLSDEL